MFVKDQMTPHPITITADSSILAAQRIMKENHVRHLPVLNKTGALVGLVTRTSLEQVRPSKLTTLSIYELSYQLDKITVRDAMVRKVVTVGEEVPIEQAARLMLEHKIGSLPVLRGERGDLSGRLVGIITDTDLMRTMLELLGARQPGVRLTLKVPDTAGELARVTAAIAAEHGDIGAMGTLPSDEPLKWWVVLKVRYIDRDCLVAAIKGLPEVELVDVRSE
jgi:acetoin utilization protein AcuB